MFVCFFTIPVIGCTPFTSQSRRYCILVEDIGILVKGIVYLFLYKPSNWLHQVKVELNCAESISSIHFFFSFDRLLNRKHKRLQSHVLVLALNAPIANDWSSLWNIVKNILPLVIVISCKFAVKFCNILHFVSFWQHFSGCNVRF